MNIEEYQERVIALFRDGKATDEQWKAMAYAVLYVSESLSNDIVASIDKVFDDEELSK